MDEFCFLCLLTFEEFDNTVTSSLRRELGGNLAAFSLEEICSATNQGIVINKKMKLGTWAVYLMQEFKAQGFHRGERKQTHDSGRS